jgi:ureidoglycolate lyase
VTTLEAAAILPEQFKPFGIVYDLGADDGNGEGDGVIRSAGDGYRDGYTQRPLIDRPGSLGLTQAAALPRVIGQMERHLHTMEAMMCAGEPVAFCVAPAGDEPAALDARAFLLMPGQAVVLHPGTWHSPAFGVRAPAAYYWMAEAYDGEPTVWMDIRGGSIRIEATEGFGPDDIRKVHR